MTSIVSYLSLLSTAVNFTFESIYHAVIIEGIFTGTISIVLFIILIKIWTYKDKKSDSINAEEEILFSKLLLSTFLGIPFFLLLYHSLMCLLATNSVAIEKMMKIIIK